MVAWLKKTWRTGLQAPPKSGAHLLKHWLALLISAACVTILILVIWDGYLRWGQGWIWAAWADEKSFGGKKIWEWLELLIVPIVLALGAFLLQRSERNNEQKLAEQRRQDDQVKIKDQQRETALQAYIDKMTELLLDKEHPLRDSKPGDEVRVVARTRTLATLRGLDPVRKGMLVIFLLEARLIAVDPEDLPTVDLADADLSGINLNNIYLAGANLSQANLVGAHMRKANLSDVDFSKAILRDTDMSEANLLGANLHRACLDNANLFGADLPGVNLSLAKLNRANLSQSNLIEADLTGAKLIETNLSGAHLRKADLRGADLRGANLRAADLCDANLRGVDLREVNLDKTYLEGANLIQAKMTPEQLAMVSSLENAKLPEV